MYRVFRLVYDYDKNESREVLIHEYDSETAALDEVYTYFKYNRDDTTFFVIRDGDYDIYCLSIIQNVMWDHVSKYPVRHFGVE